MVIGRIRGEVEARCRRGGYLFVGKKMQNDRIASQSMLPLLGMGNLGSTNFIDGADILDF